MFNFRQCYTRIFSSSIFTELEIKFDTYDAKHQNNLSPSWFNVTFSWHFKENFYLFLLAWKIEHTTPLKLQLYRQYTIFLTITYMKCFLHRIVYSNTKLHCKSLISRHLYRYTSTRRLYFYIFEEMLSFNEQP